MVSLLGSAAAVVRRGPIALVLLAAVLAGCGAADRHAPRETRGAAARRDGSRSHRGSPHGRGGPRPVLVTVPAATSAHGSSGSRQASGSRRGASSAAAGARAARHPAAPADPGRLPQTTARPPASSARLDVEMGDLWRGVLSGRVGPAMPAFFPEAAYLQVKAIADPAADWRDRLVGGFAADIAAAHALLGAGAPSARLLAVNVPESYAHWVPPGVCYNSVGYWEVPNSRVVYREDGEVRSFGIASMISWRGVWYVVHLGAVLPPGPGGVVDDPSTGPGVSAYSSTC